MRIDFQEPGRSAWNSLCYKTRSHFSFPIVCNSWQQLTTWLSSFPLIPSPLQKIIAKIAIRKQAQSKKKQRPHALSFIELSSVNDHYMNADYLTKAVSIRTFNFEFSPFWNQWVGLSNLKVIRTAVLTMGIILRIEIPFS